MVDGYRSIRASELIGVAPAVFVFPEDIELTSGPNSYHRQFMDLYISQFEYSYFEALLSYQKTLLQRNRLLKAISKEGDGKGQLEAWDKLLVADGAKIVSSRKQFIESISQCASEIYAKFDNNVKLMVMYIPKIAPDESDAAIAMEKLVAHYRVRELRAGLTFVGPHRDRLEIILDGKMIRHFGSRGQKRCAMMALKLATAQFLSKSKAQNVILILDEVFAELDRQKSQALLEILADTKQVFIATAGEFDSGSLKVNKFHITNGKIRES